MDGESHRVCRSGGKIKSQCLHTKLPKPPGQVIHKLYTGYPQPWSYPQVIHNLFTGYPQPPVNNSEIIHSLSTAYPQVISIPQDSLDQSAYTAAAGGYLVATAPSVQVSPLSELDYSVYAVQISDDILCQWGETAH